jgi:hypothetical protein
MDKNITFEPAGTLSILGYQSLILPVFLAFVCQNTLTAATKQ